MFCVTPFPSSDLLLWPVPGGSWRVKQARRRNIGRVSQFLSGEEEGR